MEFRHDSRGGLSSQFGCHLRSSGRLQGTPKLQWFSGPFSDPFLGNFWSLWAHHFRAFFRAFLEAVLGRICRVCGRGLEARFRWPCRWKRRFPFSPFGFLWTSFLESKSAPKTESKSLPKFVKKISSKIVQFWFPPSLRHGAQKASKIALENHWKFDAVLGARILA